MAALSRGVSALRALVSQSGAQKRLCHDGFARINVYKDAALAPKEMDDKDYPDWLWRIQDERPTKEDLVRRATQLFNAGGYDAVFTDMPERDLLRLFRLDQRDRIRSENGRRRGGKVV